MGLQQRWAVRLPLLCSSLVNDQLYRMQDAARIA
jgi:hypothetical protein